MSGWQIIRLGDICSQVTSGGTPLRSVREYYDGGTIPWLKTGEVKKGYVWEVDEHITERGLKESSAKLIPVNSLIVAMYGDGNTAGNVAINKVPLATNQACCNFTLNPKSADFRYVYHYLKASYSNLVGLKLGGSQQNLNAATLKSFPIHLPSLATQQKIAAVLSAYDDLIANNQRRITLLERMAEDIYREWFVRLRFPGHESAKIEKGVPQGWTTMPSDAAFEILGGGTPNTDTAAYWNGDIPFFTPKDATENIYALSTEKNITENGLRACSTQIFPKNTVFITARGTVGKLALAGQAMAMNQSCYALKPKQSGSVYFHYLAIRESITYIKSVSKSGVFDNIVMDTFKNVPILMPPQSLIDSFNRQIEPFFKQVVNLLEQRQCLAKTRDSLLPRLISGKLSVDALDIHFPPGMQKQVM